MSPFSPASKQAQEMTDYFTGTANDGSVT